MNSIMQSIKPQYCELIAAGKKTREVRKTRPKIETPFKVYIYCTKSQNHFRNNGLVHSLDDLYRMPNGEMRYGYSGELMCCGEPYNENNFLNGKVIGEYICDEITEYTTEFHPADDLFQGIWKTVFDEDADDTYGEIVTGNDFDNPDDCDICKKSCLTFNDIRNYVGYGDKKFYGYHISNLKIYNEPKALSEFRKPCKCLDEYEGEVYCDCLNCEDAGDSDWGIIACDRTITRPPQSWFYCEEILGEFKYVYAITS